MNVNKELLRKIEDLRSFCEVHGFPLHEVLEEELEYYRKDILTRFSKTVFDMIPVTEEQFKMIEVEYESYLQD